MMSMARLTAAALSRVPTRKKTEAACIVGFRPYLVQVLEATKLASSAARYREDVNSWRPWLSYLQ